MQKSPSAADRRIGARIRSRRMMIGMSQVTLAEKLGLTFQQVQKYERGINRIGAGRLQEIARILGMPIGYFYDDTDEHMPVSVDRTDNRSVTPPSTHQGARLFQAFDAIASPHLRRKALELVEAIASIKA